MAMTTSQDLVLARLTPALEIFEGFQRRNKNQHRLSKWWSMFDMLRRHARRLVRDINTQLDGLEGKLSSFGNGGKSSSKGQKGTDLERERKRKTMTTVSFASAAPARQLAAASEGAKSRATHIRSQIVPRAYLAFSRLAADGQFAPMGLALLGLLAQVDSAVRPLAPVARDAVVEPGEGEEEGMIRPETIMVGGGPELAVVCSDVGTPVARRHESLDVPEEKRSKGWKAKRTIEEVEEDVRPGEDGRGESAIEREKRAKRVPRKRKDDAEDVFASLLADVPRKKNKTLKKPKDDIDALFSSLL